MTLVESQRHRIYIYKVKYKVHPITGHEGPDVERRYTSTLSLTTSLDGGGGSTPHPSCFIHGKDPVPIVYEAGWALGPVLTGMVNLEHTGIRSPYLPAP
jgi:hypothetical protein